MTSGLTYHGLGWVPDLPDARDKYFQVTKPMLEQLPQKVDLRTEDALKFPIFDQGRLGACTANAIGASFAYAYYKERMGKMMNADNNTPAVNPYFIPSRLFIYYNERMMEGTINSDSGAMLRDGIKSVNRWGVCSEGTWPYMIDRFAQRPNDVSYREGKQYQALKYERLVSTNPDALRACLADGYPFVMGFTVYESFMSRDMATSGIMQMPKPGERVMGGHAVLAVGYDDANQWLIVRNSWGETWGDKGHFYMPLKYATNDNLAADFWDIRIVEQGPTGTVAK